MKDTLERYLLYLRSPWAILAGVVGGILIGLFSMHLSMAIGPWGDLYVRVLEMTINPIMSAAVISGVGKLIKGRETRRYLKKLVVIFFLGMLIASSFGIVYSKITRPGGDLPIETEIRLGQIITKYEAGQKFEVVPEAFISVGGKEENIPENLYQFFSNIIPSNIFHSYTVADSIKILFFSLLFGISLGFSKDAYSLPILNGISGLLSVFEQIIFFVLYLLPFALICLISKQIAMTGTEIFSLLYRYLIFYFLAIFLILALNFVLIWRITKEKFITTLSTLKEALLIAFSSSSSFVALPSTLKALTRGFQLKASTVNLFLPIGIGIYAFGTICFYAFNTIFFLQLYEIDIPATSYLIILIGSMLVGMTSAGNPAVTKLAAMANIFTPLGLPSAPAIAILAAVKPITQPFEVAVDLQANCLLTSFLAPKAPKPSPQKKTTS